MSASECRMEAENLRATAGQFPETERNVILQIADAWDRLAGVLDEREIIRTRYLISN